LSNKEEEYLIKKHSKNEVKTPIFGPPDGKIIAAGELFRGPSTGITSEMDLQDAGEQEW